MGDTKSVLLSGTVGTLSINTTLYAYIIGFNHRSVNGITFQGFKTAAAGDKSTCLVSQYNNSNSTGLLSYFTINHWGSTSSPYNTNYSGWKGCDLRYDILGSTDKAPSGYGATATTSRTGYDASDTTATNPKTNTIMSCLPSKLRAVIQPMTVYTDNKGGSSNIAANVTTSVDYLPLLAEYEIFGYTTYANTYEPNAQSQYIYYSSGNSKINYQHTDTSGAAYWWCRSVRRDANYAFCDCSNTGAAHANASRVSYGLAPIFLV